MCSLIWGLSFDCVACTNPPFFTEWSSTRAELTAFLSIVGNPPSRRHLPISFSTGSVLSCTTCPIDAVLDRSSEDLTHKKKSFVFKHTFVPYTTGHLLPRKMTELGMPQIISIIILPRSRQAVGRCFCNSCFRSATTSYATEFIHLQVYLRDMHSNKARLQGRKHGVRS